MSDIIRERKQGNLIVVSGPSGAGKGSVISKLMEVYDNAWLSVSMTSREVRSNDIPGKTYFFVSKDDLIEFQKYQQSGKGEIVAMVPNDGQVKSGETYEFEVGSVNVEGGVLSTLKVNGETVLEYMDTEDPIYDQGHFAFYIHKTLGPVYISPIK